MAHFYEPTWESLRQYQVPDWFRDAKFGIFLHWGVQSVPAAGLDGWYARHMYMQEGAPWGRAYQQHVQHYGHPSSVGYKDLIPLWRAERWDPDALVALFSAVGARYIVPVAVHHDNFDLFNSTHQPWNAINMGPRRDVIAEWKRATTDRGLRFGVSSHADRTWEWFSTAHSSDRTGPYAGVPYDGVLTRADGAGTWWEGYDPQDLYVRPHRGEEAPDRAYCEKWLRRTIELLDNYEPDLLYFDGPLPIVCGSDACKKERYRLSRYGLEIAAHFYNSNQRRHGGRLEAVLNVKLWEPDSVPDQGAVVLDIEKGQSDRLRNLVWQTDTSLNKNW